VDLLVGVDPTNDDARSGAILAMSTSPVGWAESTLRSSPPADK
jgi:hypothetical protein